MPVKNNWTCFFKHGWVDPLKINFIPEGLQTKTEVSHKHLAKADSARLLIWEGRWSFLELKKSQGTENYF